MLKSCRFCGSDFKIKTNAQRYCSSICSKKAHIKNRAKYENSSKGVATRKANKQNKSEYDKKFYQKIKSDPNFIEKKKVRMIKWLKENKDKVNKTSNTYILKRRKNDPINLNVDLFLLKPDFFINSLILPRIFIANLNNGSVFLLFKI